MRFNQRSVSFVALSLLFMISSCAHKNISTIQPLDIQASDRQPSAKAALPDQANWQHVEDKATSLVLNAANIQLKMSTGGTSVYAVIVEDGKPIGAVIPENDATRISGEIAAFHLARAVGVADIFQPGVYLDIQDDNLTAYKNLLMKNASKVKNSQRKNLEQLQDFFGKNPNSMPTVFKVFGIKPKEYDEIVSGNRFKTTHIIPGSKVAFARFLQCVGPKPSETIQLRLNGGKAPEAELARQLSSIFIIDAITGQWDRFSGGNLQTLTDNGRVKFASMDNGGTWGGLSWTTRSLSYVTRVDKHVANQIIKMDDFLTKGGNFDGLTTENDFFTALGLEKFPNVRPKLKASIKATANHLRSNKVCYF